MSPTSNTSQPPTAERTPSMMEKMKFRRRSVDTQSTNKRGSKDQQAITSANMAGTPTNGAESTLYSSGDWSDVTVACKNHVWHLHKEILTSRCDYFRDKCMTEQAHTPAGVSSIFGSSTYPHIDHRLLLRFPRLSLCKNLNASQLCQAGY